MEISKAVQRITAGLFVVIQEGHGIGPLLITAKGTG